MLCSGSDNQGLGAVINLATHCVRIAALELTAGSYLGQLKKTTRRQGLKLPPRLHQIKRKKVCL